MTFKAPAISVLALIALAGSAASGAAEPHNIILFIPEALPAIVEEGSAPTLTRLRDEGVHFANSHSGFPNVNGEDPTDVAPDLKVLSLIDAASQNYATAFVYDERAPGDGEVGPQLRQFLGGRLPDIQRSGRPFLFIYRLIEAKSSPPPAPGETRRAYKTDPRAADASLDAIETTLKSLGLAEATNIVVTGEHGLSRIVKVSNTSSARKPLPREETLGTLPPGFLAIDLLAAVQTEDLAYNLFDSDNSDALVHRPSGETPKHGNAIIAMDYDPNHPYLTVKAHGVYDTIHIADSLSPRERRDTARLIVEAVLEQDYVGAIFVNKSRVGRVPGALPLAQIADENADEPAPDVLVAFASVSDGCVQPLTCMYVIADTPLAEGVGIPNSFSRAGTYVFMAARGPDFRSNCVDRAPASNADIARTVAELLHLDLGLVGRTKGRVLAESLAGDRGKISPQARKTVSDSKAADDGSVSRLTVQSLGRTQTYFYAALPSTHERMALAEPRRRTKWHWPFKTFTITLSDDKY